MRTLLQMFTILYSLFCILDANLNLLPILLIQEEGGHLHFGESEFEHLAQTMCDVSCVKFQLITGTRSVISTFLFMGEKTSFRFSIKCLSPVVHTNLI